MLTHTFALSYIACFVGKIGTSWPDQVILQRMEEVTFSASDIIQWGRSQCVFLTFKSCLYVDLIISDDFFPRPYPFDPATLHHMDISMIRFIPTLVFSHLLIYE